MSEEKDLKAVDTVITAGGLNMETKLRLGSLLHIKEKYGDDFDANKIDHTAELIFCLIKQANDELQDDKIRKVVNRLDLPELQQIGEKIKAVFEVSVKNSPSPANP